MFCDEDWNGNTPRIAIQAAHDGSDNHGTNVDLSGHNVSYSKNTVARVHIEEKSNSICYHAIRESVAIKENLTEHVPSVDNMADICTKVFPGGEKWKHLICKVLHDLYEH